MCVRMRFSYLWVKKYNSADNCILDTLQMTELASSYISNQKTQTHSKLMLSAIFSRTIW